jgi:hypothetical protein
VDNNFAPLSDPTSWAPVGGNQPITPTGSTFGGQLDTFSSDVQLCCYPDMPQTIFIQGPNTPPQPTVAGDTFIGYGVYRGRAGFYGWVGWSQGPEFIDQGQSPDMTTCPPEGINPFETTQGEANTAESPTAVTYFQDRLSFGGTPSRPTFIFSSATGDYDNFDQHIIPSDSDAVIESLLARKRELILSLVGLDYSRAGSARMFCLTNGGVWSLSGAQGTPFSADSVDAQLHSDVGSDWPHPVVIGGTILYARNKGSGVRAISFDWERGGVTVAPASDLAEHLFLGYQVADWDYAEDPWGLVWVARSDGLLLSGTHSPEDGLWGWAQHQIQGPGSGRNLGLTVPQSVLSVCCIPEGPIPPSSTTYSNAVNYNAGAIVNDGSGNFYISQQGGKPNGKAKAA